MKKSKLFILFILSCFILTFLSGCNNNIYKKITGAEKPNSFFYTNDLLSELENNKCSAILLDTNLFTEKTLSNVNINTIKQNLGILKESNFIKNPKSLPKKPVFKIFITSSTKKYVINIYNKKYLSIHPWDGKYGEDFIDEENVYSSLNLFSLCKFLMNR